MLFVVDPCIIFTVSLPDYESSAENELSDSSSSISSS